MIYHESSNFSQPCTETAMQNLNLQSADFRRPSFLVLFSYLSLSINFEVYALSHVLITIQRAVGVIGTFLLSLNLSTAAQGAFTLSSKELSLSNEFDRANSSSKKANIAALLGANLSNTRRASTLLNSVNAP
jgi:hypothetical protein